MQTIAVINQKGGCGKTTTAISLSGFFAARGWRTLLVDMDPQSHCAAGLAIPEARIDLSIGDAMLAAVSDDPLLPPVEPDRLLWRVSRNLDLAPSNMRLAGLEALRGGLATEPDPEKRLSRVLASLSNRYDLAVIDCSPAIGLLAYNALVAAGQILVPVETGFFSLQGATKQVSTIKALAKRLEISLSYRLLPTLHDQESVLARDLLDELHRRFPGQVIPIPVRYDPALKEAASFGQPVGEYAPDSTGAADYGAVADWLIEHALRRPSIRAGLAPLQPAQPIVITAPSESPVPSTTDRPLGPLAAATATAAMPAPPAPISRAQEMVERTRRTHEQASPAPATAERRAPTLQARTGSVPSLGANITAEGVLFVQPASLGARIEIAGDFNGWSPERSPMALNRARGVFELFIPLPPAGTRYRLVVDGRWMADPFNADTARTDQGETASLLIPPEANIA